MSDVQAKSRVRETFQEVSQGHSGMGVHRLNLTPDGNPEAKEYGVPNAHHAKRKRGPGVTAPGMVMSKRNVNSEGHAVKGEQLNSIHMAPSMGSTEAQAPGTLNSRAILQGFHPGGCLRTVSATGKDSNLPT